MKKRNIKKTQHKNTKNLNKDHSKVDKGVLYKQEKESVLTKRNRSDIEYSQDDEFKFDFKAYHNFH